MGTVAPADASLGAAAKRNAVVSGQDDLGDSAVVEFHCTAFGKFHNIPVNPTELLVRGLPAHLAQTPLPPGMTLASASVLDVAALRSKVTLERMHSKIVPQPCIPSALEDSFTSGVSPEDVPAIGRCCPSAKLGFRSRAPGSPPRTVFLHLGINAAVTRYELELQARNEATFSCPDEAGWSPVRSHIDEDLSKELSYVRKTRLPVYGIASQLRERGFDVGVSSDAGRFVCNFVYYNSLRMAEKNGSLALFVHVPPTSSQPLENQLAFFSALLETLALFVESMASVAHPAR